MDSFDLGNEAKYPWQHTYKTSVFYDKKTTIRGIVGTACVFSMIGSLLIILSYLFAKQLRTQTRKILLHLSLMDFGTALANFVGLTVYFDKYYIEAEQEKHNFWEDHLPSKAVQYSCIGDAFVAVYCTNSSVLWTISMAVYLHFRIVSHSQRSEKFYQYLLYIFYVFNYGFPLLISLWMVFTDKLGFAPWDSSGWCTIIVEIPPHGVKTDRIASFFGSDLWILITIVIIPPLYLSIKIHAKRQLSSVMKEVSSNAKLRAKLYLIDFKFTAIPLVFILLRIWTLIISIVYDYAHVSEDKIPNWVEYILLYLSGIGDSGQGAANGIIFVIFTQKVREIFFKKCCRKDPETLEESSDYFSIKNKNSFEDSPLISTSTNSPLHKYESGGKTLYIIQSH